MVTHPPEPTSSPLNVHLILFDLSHLNKYSSGPTICFKPRTSVPKSRYSPIGKKKETIKTKTHTHTYIFKSQRKTNHSFSSSRNFGPEFALFFLSFRIQYTHHQNLRDGNGNRGPRRTLNGWGRGRPARRQCLSQ